MSLATHVITCQVDHRPEGAGPGATVKIIDEYQDPDKFMAAARSDYPNCDLKLEEVER